MKPAPSFISSYNTPLIILQSQYHCQAPCTSINLESLLTPQEKGDIMASLQKDMRKKRKAGEAQLKGFLFHVSGTDRYFCISQMMVT